MQEQVWDGRRSWFGLASDRLTAQDAGLVWSRSYRSPWPQSWGFRIAIPWSLIDEIRVVQGHTAPVPGLVLRDFEALEDVPQKVKHAYYLQSDRVFRLNIRFEKTAAAIVDELVAYKRAVVR